MIDRLFLVLCLFASAASVSCGPSVVPTVSASALDGSPSVVLAVDAAGAARLEAGDDAERTYLIDPPLLAGLPGQPSDLAVTVASDGKVSVDVAGPGNDFPVLVRSTVPALSGGLVELRIPLEPGMVVASVRLGLVGAAWAEPVSLRVTPAFRGYDAGSSPVVVSSDVTLSFRQPGDRLPVSIAFGPSPFGWDAWLSGTPSDESVVTLGGAVSFRVVATPRAPAALPLGIAGIGPYEASCRAGLVEASIRPGLGAPLTDLHMILDGPPPTGDFRLYRWDVQPRTLVMDFRDYATQDRYLKRLAFFAEKPGFRGRLAADPEIAGLHGWNAHDYPPWTLAAFFGMAEKDGFPLNGEERALGELLIGYGVIVRRPDGGLEPGEGALVSIARESSDELRRTFIDHEASHALFFQDAEYRALAASLWESHSRAVTDFWLIHFRWRRYDVTDEYLLLNELQAYLVQQPTTETAAYLGDNVLPRLATAYPDRAPGLLAARDEIMAVATSDAAMLNAYLSDRRGLGAGDFSRLAR